MTNEDRVSKFIAEIKDAPAFPSVFPADTVGYAAGLTKREWMAAMNVQGMLANERGCQRVFQACLDALPDSSEEVLRLETMKQIAYTAIAQADDLLAELAKPKEETK